jgi:RNA polymerase sigma-70 factor (ECF subfamily)
MIAAPSRTKTVKSVQPPVSDEELLIAYAQSSKRELFAELVSRYERELYSYLRRYLGHNEQAEDAFQATFLQVHLKCQQFEAGRKFRPWLYAVATNQAIDLQRRNKRHRSVSLDRTVEDAEIGTLLDMLASAEPLPGEQLTYVERSNWLTETLAQLPESLMQVLQLVYFQGLKYREAAEALDLPVGTVKSRVHVAIVKLTEAWNATHTETP